MYVYTFSYLYGEHNVSNYFVTVNFLWYTQHLELIRVSFLSTKG